MLNNQFFKLIIMFINNMDRFEKKLMKKIIPIKKTWYDWLINHIPEPTKKV